MKKKIINTLVLLLTAGSSFSQPLFHYSQFVLSDIMGRYTKEVEQTYAGNIINVFASVRKSPVVVRNTKQLLAYRATSKCREEKEIPIRQRIDSLVDTTQYLFLSPRNNRDNKVLLGLFLTGFECIWALPTGDRMYVLHRVSSEKGRPSYIALVYNRKTNTTNYANAKQLKSFYIELKKALKERSYSTPRTPAENSLANAPCCCTGLKN
ncbi:hypothetical protein KBC03_00350 [Patescibacteria group bacterium]|nr:hypothetical protein [Patescibacteria group bacterium]